MGHSVEYCEDISKLSETKLNIIDSLVIKESTEYLNAQSKNIGLIHLVDHTINSYNDYDLIVTGEAAKIDLVENCDISDDKIKVVLPGMDNEWRRKESHKKEVKNLLSVSNFIPGKGVDILISVLNQLKSYPWTLKIAGNKKLNSSYYEEIIGLIEKYGLEDRIELIGSISRQEINNLMIEADVMLNFSEKETFGMAVQEAIHARLPVVIYKTGAWETFEASGLVMIVDDYTHDKFLTKLQSIFEEGIDLNGIDQFEEIPRRTWKLVGQEIESILLQIEERC